MCAVVLRLPALARAAAQTRFEQGQQVREQKEDEITASIIAQGTDFDLKARTLMVLSVRTTFATRPAGACLRSIAIAPLPPLTMSCVCPADKFQKQLDAERVSCCDIPALALSLSTMLTHLSDHSRAASYICGPGT
mgnify:CR=1 FL=1